MLHLFLIHSLALQVVIYNIMYNISVAILAQGRTLPAAFAASDIWADDVPAVAGAAGGNGAAAQPRAALAWQPHILRLQHSEQ